MAKIKVSDYILQFVADQGIHKLFLISGGGMMHLLDSAARQEGLDLIFNLNEQASAICAESYAQFTGGLGACMVTTGPGATNAVTGCAGAWTDGTPVLFISGQCKTEQMGQLKGLRIYGAQEIAIVPCVKPITKYAVTVLKKEEIRYHLEKAVYIAMHGRKGPVWIDVPLDIQGASVDTDHLIGFDPENEETAQGPWCVTDDQIEAVYNLLNKAKRPALLIGHGVAAAHAKEQIRELVQELQIPVLATWRAKDVFGDEEELFMGAPGAPAARYANYVLQNTDFLLIIGTRLNPAITAFDEPHFAPNAKKVIVDIEQGEMDKLNMDFALKLTADAGAFLTKLAQGVDRYERADRAAWLDYCRYIKKKYPLSREKQPYPDPTKTDGFLFAQKLSEYSKVSDVFVGSSSGRTCGISHMAYILKRGQRFVTSMGLGSMGWCVPSAVACCLASGQRTLVIEGDGSLQHNLQELALIHTYHLALKIFVFSNGGYASIYTMQRNNFEGRFAGCNSESGLGLPSMEKIAALYELPYYCIHNDREIDSILAQVMCDDRPCLCEVEGSIRFDEIPKSVTTANPDGSFSSCKLENLYPFVTEEEQQENIPDWSRL